MPTGIIDLILNALRGRVATVIQHGITAGCLWLVAHGVSQAQSNDISSLLNPTAIAGAVIGILNVVFDAWSTHYGNKLISAVRTGARGGQVLGSVGKASPVILAFLFLGASAKAQTNVSVTNDDSLILPGLTILSSTVSTNAVQTATDVGEMLDQLLPAGLSLTNFSSLNVSADGTLANGHNWGGMLAIDGFYSTTNSAGGLSLGMAAEYVGEDWFFAPVNVKISTTINIPVINQPLYIWASDSPSVRYRDAAIGSQTLVGGAFNIKLSSKIGLVLDGGRGENTQSDAPGFYFGGARVQIALQ